MAAFGLGRLGPSASLPGDPGDDRGWSFTGWFDTTEAQALLDFQEHDWRQTLAWIAESQGHLRTVLRAAGPDTATNLAYRPGSCSAAPRDEVPTPTRGRWSQRAMAPARLAAAD